eukprot:TRINITY_DN17768_c0_g1_i1.p1 TRINITY_DN17768_c0_g1~~TRINITY_DN17768_c0_g1_i1.p1  ORF type:complete len:182 (-),score=10.72 TRINITY_DN17768_c0_g1_i1:51-596(-)
MISFEVVQWANSFDQRESFHSFQKPENKIIVKVCTPNNCKMCYMSLYPSTTIDQLKRRIECDWLGLSSDNLRLISGGKELKKGQLIDYNISSSSSIFVIAVSKQSPSSTFMVKMANSGQEFKISMPLTETITNIKTQILLQLGLDSKTGLLCCANGRILMNELTLSENGIQPGESIWTVIM